MQEDLYPETQADIPAITAEEWWVQRKNADPVLMSMADGGGSNSQSEELVVKKVILFFFDFLSNAQCACMFVFIDKFLVR